MESGALGLKNAVSDGQIGFATVPAWAASGTVQAKTPHRRLATLMVRCDGDAPRLLIAFLLFSAARRRLAPMVVGTARGKLRRHALTELQIFAGLAEQPRKSRLWTEHA
jgi:hypothetical protein